MTYQTSPLLPNHLEGIHTNKNFVWKGMTMQIQLLAREHNADMLNIKPKQTQRFKLSCKFSTHSEWPVSQPYFIPCRFRRWQSLLPFIYIFLWKYSRLAFISSCFWRLSWSCKHFENKSLTVHGPWIQVGSAVPHNDKVTSAWQSSIVHHLRHISKQQHEACISWIWLLN